MNRPYEQVVKELDRAREYLDTNPEGAVEVLIATLGDKMVAEVIVKRVLLKRYPKATITYIYSGGERGSDH